jgi:alanine dehydrogenase
MIIGVPKEIKNQENRVSLTPAGVKELTKIGHTIYVENNAGTGSSITNEDYINAGAEILATPNEVFQKSDMIVKVKEPQMSEVKMIKENQIIFTYLHLAPLTDLTDALLESKCIAIAYETVQNARKELPLLIPMSEVAGRLSVHAGTRFLEKPNGGSGVLLGGVPGVQPGEVVIIGGGIAGTKAAKAAIGAGAKVTILERSLPRMRYLSDIFGGRMRILMSNEMNITHALESADLIVGAVLIPGLRAPKVITKEMLGLIKKGSVIVDIAVDQGGCIETSRPTTHDDPIYSVDGIIHYCVTNMPGAVPITSTYALTNATLPYIIDLANNGIDAIRKDIPLQLGVNTFRGKLTCEAVAESQERASTELASLL